MVDKQQIIKDVLRDLIMLSKSELWKNFEKRDDIAHTLKFAASSLKNIHVEHVLLLKALDALMSGYTLLAYNILYSNNKLGTQEEEITDKKFNNVLTNFTGRLKLFSEML